MLFSINCKFTFFLISLLLFFHLPVTVYGIDSEEKNTDDLKVGVVLSGGGAKGIAHIGVLKVLEEAGIHIDYIAGTSMGSAVGALYAIGYTSDELREIALTTDWDNLFSDTPSRRYLSMFEKDEEQRFIASFPISDRGINLPRGLVPGQNIFTWMNRYIWPKLAVRNFDDLPIPFATVATDIETGEAVIFRSGFLPDAIRASISFPSLLTPYQIGDKTMVDGGLIRNLPVQEVLDMGADYVIAVDVSGSLRSAEDLSSITSILNQTVSFRMRELVDEQLKMADLLIDIRELSGFSVTDFDDLQLYMNIGEEHARKHLGHLKKIGEKQNRRIQPPIDRKRLGTEIHIGNVSVHGSQNITAEFIINDLEIQAGMTVTREQIEASINRLYSSKLFNLLTYELENWRQDEQTGEPQYHLKIRVVENMDDSFSVGVRYENETQASIFLNSSFRNLAMGGTNLRLGLRLGNDASFQADYLLFAGIGSRMALNLQAGFFREGINYYEETDRISSVTNNLTRLDMTYGTFMHHTYLFGVGFRRDFNTKTRKINPEQIPFSGADHNAVYGTFLLDTFNRRSYTNRGHRLLLEATFSDDFTLSNVRFSQQKFFWQGWYPLHDNLSLQNTIFLGRSFGDELPWPYWFSPNRQIKHLGFVRFGGFHRYQLSGRNIHMASAGLQFEAARHRFIRFDAYTGNTFETWNFNPLENDYYTGYSLSIGTLTVLGPIEAIFSTSTQNRFVFELQVGYQF